MIARDATKDDEIEFSKIAGNLVSFFFYLNCAVHKMLFRPVFQRLRFFSLVKSKTQYYLLKHKFIVQSTVLEENGTRGAFVRCLPLLQKAERRARPA